ncbi:hypothetical protein DL96DRAFT_1697017 [Flagelloscypha sp. PMI_526]|nr:hypothetical protein DL96DRAFT_1697017 [Flagelloscypha sp. PMI_526]
MPPRKKVVGESGSGTATPQTPSLVLSLSYAPPPHGVHPRPFKSPNYTKNINRRAKNLKALLTQEKERDARERDARRLARDAVNAVGKGEEDPPTYASIEAPPSLLPQLRWCDITGLEGPYTDPSTGLRYHDRHVYGVVKSLNMPHARNYLAARGVASVVK